LNSIKFISPLSSRAFARLPKIPGVSMASGVAGIRHRGKKDLLLVEFTKNTTVAGVLTKNEVCGAPIRWCREILPKGKARALLVNSGNANVHTGKIGEQSVAQMAKEAARLTGCSSEEILVASTGVIGELFPITPILQTLPNLFGQDVDKTWKGAAEAIMTTDTYPKAAFRRTEIDGVPIKINGIAKGSGMIAPNMGTMLAFIFTDANLSSRLLSSLLKPAVESSFNCISVDGDTSTSDTCLLFATGKASNTRIINCSDKNILSFQNALNDIAMSLAMQIVRDGEGVTRVAEIQVLGAKSNESAKNVAKSVANSPLFKTALAAADPNWGRIVSAAGNAGEKVDQSLLTLCIGNELVAVNGALSPDYSEPRATRHMRSKTVRIELNLNQGKGKATVWGCDLTHQYIDINAGYRS